MKRYTVRVVNSIKSLWANTILGGATRADGTDAGAVVNEEFFPPYAANTFAFTSLAAATVVAPAAAPTVTAASLPRITSTELPAIATVKRITLQATAKAGASAADSPTCMGWLVVINAAGESAAAATLVNALDTNIAGGGIQSYGVTMTATVLPNIAFVPANGEAVTIDLDDVTTLSTLFILDIHSETTAVGACYMSATLGIPA